MTDNAQLVEVRCTLDRVNKKDNKIYPCNFLCVKVYPGSKGEAFCGVCKLAFDFVITEQAVANTFIRVKSIK